ncbi:2-hydroxy-6-oxo-2,4-heptadienoate hydrolase [Acinetobacter baumannii]|uniref:alpha/beta fold hydrolase n=1 Tax=Acinetobacter baumannii TaxID=470 RepID=UPI000A353369|nr:alpha/beta hydrolase [Acinetobacter baumannii]MCT9165206.1 alpha/beta fold hydrolase [Acinetobacter baumannii]MCT9171845.1 alpha/beta fold hydrolase [Acinetobacter baumannii]MCT9179548.1 alpha/beta fold hydrolase [Acinetobacter baumannii]OTK48624.1 2-hydroxy-6-oxo-2,4-heptadienoate hydrolase [Acinetobacter baumannii]
MNSLSNTPEIASKIVVNGIETNYHDLGEGEPILLIHGSGPGVTAWANWRLVLPELSKISRVIAPDIVGFGYTDRPEGFDYTPQNWVKHLIGFIDALGLEKVSLVGNSFGGALALMTAVECPERINKIVLMGSVGVGFDLTDGLNKVWGYEPSVENMKEVLNIFAFNQELITDDLAKSRYEASTRPGFHESFSAMFPEPRQRGVELLTVPESSIKALKHHCLIIHGYEDKVIPFTNSLKLFSLLENAELHGFRKCGHWVQIEKAGPFSALLKDFFTRK